VSWETAKQLFCKHKLHISFGSRTSFLMLSNIFFNSKAHEYIKIWNMIKNNYLFLFTQIKNQYFYFYHDIFFPLYSSKLEIYFSYISDDSRIYIVPFPVCVTIASFRYHTCHVISQNIMWYHSYMSHDIIQL
jgi:hypothetical protein